MDDNDLELIRAQRLAQMQSQFVSTCIHMYISSI